MEIVGCLYNLRERTIIEMLDEDLCCALARVIVEGQMSFFLLVTNLDVMICVFELNEQLQ